jgi:hypothetical protein
MGAYGATRKTARVLRTLPLFLAAALSEMMHEAVLAADGMALHI